MGILSRTVTVGVLFDNQHYPKIPEEAAAEAIKAGNGIRVSHTYCSTPSSFGLHIDVKNTDGTHTLLVFSTPPGKWSATKQLIGFHRVHITAGSQQTVRVNIHVCRHLSFVDRFGIPMGEHTIHIGDDFKHSISLQAGLEEIKA